MDDGLGRAAIENSPLAKLAKNFGAAKIPKVSATSATANSEIHLSDDAYLDSALPLTFP